MLRVLDLLGAAGFFWVYSVSVVLVFDSYADLLRLVLFTARGPA